MKRKLVWMAAVGLLAFSAAGWSSAETAHGPVVRLADLVIDSAQAQGFEAAAREHVAAAFKSEPGLLALHAVAQRGEPARVRIFEMYVDEAAYRAHLASPHFAKFSADIRGIVKQRELYETTSIRLGSKDTWAGAPLVRVAELQITPERLGAYQAAVTEEIDASIRVEPGVFGIYSVALKQDPTQLRFFEIYANEQAYRDHIASPHFKKYVEATKDMITGRRLIETEPIVLQMRPR